MRDEGIIPYTLDHERLFRSGDGLSAHVEKQFARYYLDDEEPVTQPTGRKLIIVEGTDEDIREIEAVVARTIRRLSAS